MPSPAPRPSVAALHAYVPGEQPKNIKLIKLNTNENPYPPSPNVLEALHEFSADAVRKYPDPTCEALRNSIGRRLSVHADQVMVTNGSDEILKMVIEAWADPGDRISYLWPTYSLYPVYAAKHQAVEVRLPFSGGIAAQEAALKTAPTDLRILFVTNPNPPIGLPIPLDTIRQLAKRLANTLIVVDEAYIAYGGESAVALIREGATNVLVTRTFSKSHSLAGLRAGFGIGSAGLMEPLGKVKDSYNVCGTTQAAALASWEDEEWTNTQVAKIIATRERVTIALRARGYQVEDSAGNFLFARRADATEVFAKLRAAHILVRYFNDPVLQDGIRITIGTDEEMDALLAVV